MTLLVDLNVGLMISMVISALAGLFYGDPYIAIYALLGNLAGIYSISQYRERSGLFKSGLRVGGVNALAAVRDSLGETRYLHLVRAVDPT